MHRTSLLINKHGMMHILYYYLFMPYIVLEVWGNTNATNVHCLVLLQKKDYKITLLCQNTQLIIQIYFFTMHIFLKYQI